MGVLGIFEVCPGDILFMSRKYLLGVIEIFDGCPRYLMDAPEIFDGCPGDI